MLGYERFCGDYSSLPPAGTVQAVQAFFDEMYRETQAALQARADDMSVEERHGIKRAFFLYEWASPQGGNVGQVGMQVFSFLRELAFLKLADAIPLPGAAGTSGNDKQLDKITDF